jgi:hypothetical protein
MKEKKNEFIIECRKSQINNEEDVGYYDIFITGPNMELLANFVIDQGELIVKGLQMLAKNEDTEKPMVMPFKVNRDLLVNSSWLVGVLKEQAVLEIETEREEIKEFSYFFSALLTQIDWEGAEYRIG